LAAKTSSAASGVACEQTPGYALVVDPLRHDPERRAGTRVAAILLDRDLTVEVNQHLEEFRQDHLPDCRRPPIGAQRLQQRFGRQHGCKRPEHVRMELDALQNQARFDLELIGVLIPGGISTLPL
jgi:hypothetical protein